MTRTTILSNARLVLGDEVVLGHLVVVDGRIAEVGTGPANGGLDCEGDFLCPGLIELHTDNLERHIEPRPKVDWPHGSAIIAHDGELASCGISTVFDAMRVGSVLSSSTYLKYARQLANELLALRASGALRIDHHLHLRAEICSETLIDELAEFGPGDNVGLISLMDHTPGQRQFRDISKLRDYVCGKHGYSDAQFLEHVASQQELQARLGEKHERMAVDTARSLGAALASHDDTTAAQVAVSARHQVRLAEFPTTLEAAEACRSHGIAVMVGAPNLIRGGSHSGNVAAADLADRGLLDILSSDYVPAALLMGAVALGLRYGDMARGIATVTSAPAKATGLADRGLLAAGLRADILRFGLIEDAPVTRGLWVMGRRVA